jgi:hypothetical protein
VTDKAKRWMIWRKPLHSYEESGVVTTVTAGPDPLLYSDPVEVCPVSELEEVTEQRTAAERASIEAHRRAEQAEQQAASMREAAAPFADSVERDRREPDKLLCHLKTFRRALSQPPTDVEEETIEDLIAQGPCPECGTLGGIWHKLGCSRDPERKDPAPQQQGGGEDA